MQTAVDVLLGHRNHQAEVGFDQVLLGALGFDFAVADHRERVPQVGQVGPGGCFALADFALQFPSFGLRGLAGAALQLAQILLQVRQFVRRRARFPWRTASTARGRTEPCGSPGKPRTRARAILPIHLRRSFLLLSGTVSSLSETCTSFLCRPHDFGQVVLDLVAALGVGGALFFEVAQIDKGVQVLGFRAGSVRQISTARNCTSAERLIAFCIRSLPRSMRRARLTSPSRVSSGTAPISRRYTRTGSSV